MADPLRNFFSSTLVGTYSNVETSMTIANGSGDLLPDPSVDGEFNLVIYNESAIGVVTTYDGGSTDTRQDLADTNPEIVRVTARSGDVLTVTRGQEGTTASAKEAGNTYRVILSATKKIFDDIQTAIDNVNVTNLTGVESLVFDTTGDEEFGLPAGTTAQRPASPSAGYMRWNSTLSRIEFYNGTRWAGLSEIGFQSETMQVAQLSVTANDAEFLSPIEVEYLVIAGGGGGASTNSGGGGGGGAGGYRSSVSGESSGGGVSAESVFEPTLSTNYTVTVGAGGASGGSGDSNGGNGNNSVFASITSTGGGGGGKQTNNGLSGGSGGGGGIAANGGAGTANQGFDGGSCNAGHNGGGGGGGAAALGGDTVDVSTGGDGGNGVASSITGSSVTRGGGGGGSSNSTPGSGGTGGGGNATANGTATAGTANTGGGGGGAYDNGTSASGGSGVVILRYPSAYSITVGAGLTASTTTVGANKVTTFTAGTDTISFS